MTLAIELRAQDQEVSFFTFKGRGLGEHVRNLGFPVSEVKVRTKIDPLAIVQMARHIKRHEVDIVHAHLSTSSVNGCLAARMAGVPGVATVHGMSGKLSFAPSTHLIAVSSEVRQHLVLQGVHESKISIVPNGLQFRSVPADARQTARRILGVSEGEPVIGTTARLTRLKGVDHALSAFARVMQDFPNAKYVVFGDGEQRAELQELAVSLGVAHNVKWMGYREDVQDLLPALDVFVFPTLREAMGIAVVEAMAAGLPCVANAIGGVPEVVTADTGLLVSPSDPVAMADQIALLLRNPKLRRKMGSEAFERARTEYSAQRMAARTLGVYAACLARSNRSHLGT